MNFNKIVLGYDDSDGSRQALTLAIGLVKQNPEAQLLVAQVFEETVENIPINNEKAVEPVRTNGYLLEGIQIPPLPVYHDESSSNTHARVKHSVDNTFSMQRKFLNLIISMLSSRLLREVRQKAYVNMQWPKTLI